MQAEKKRQVMREQDPKERIKNFDEVPLGYTREQAVAEAKRCLQCANPPCVTGCPVSVDIPRFINAISRESFKEALAIIKERNALPAVTGRVCPHEIQCEGSCTLGKIGEPIAIGRLERFVADHEPEEEKPDSVNSSEKKIAVIGGGPAGLTCASELAKKGYHVVLFEALSDAGGVLRYGIPEFRLPKKILDSEIQYVKSLGVKIEPDSLVGRTFDLDEIRGDYAAVFISTGAGLPMWMDIPGENLNGVYAANEFLTRVNLMHAYCFPDYDTPVAIGKTVVTIGAGNVAMDCARTALRMGAEKSYIMYRRSEKEAPAREEEIRHAREEGVEFMFLTQPLEYLPDEKGNLKEIECIRMELGAPDSSGRRRPVPVEGSKFTQQADTVIVAIGQKPNPLLSRIEPGLKTTKRGVVLVDDNMQTSLKGVFAGGDIASGAATVILAMGAGKKAAESIDSYLKEDV